jgi:putative radical SAM enzyme (TIGR03279 family)
VLPGTRHVYPNPEHSILAPKVSHLSHRRVDLEPEATGLVEAVAKDSLGWELGIQPGDRILSLNDRPVVDVLDFQFHVHAEQVRLEVERGGAIERFNLDLDGDEYWGITFADPTFDGVRICENGCPFCFIKQIPKGMRRSLYVMDDDYRYSMLYGAFVTLTNLSEEDWERIESERLGPLHVSVHATNPELRALLVGNPIGAEILTHLGRLERAGIEFHAQLVLCPGVNDGPELDRSLSDLQQFSNLASIAGVPVGLTRFGQERQSKQLRLSRKCMQTLPGNQIQVRRYNAGEAEAVVEHASLWQQRFRKERGETFFYLGDEFYLMTGREVPTGAMYDGFPQIEDGIGITRHLLDDVDRLVRRSRRGELQGARGVVACGTLIGPTMDRIVGRLNQECGTALRLHIIDNEFFGSEINVSGLLTGADVSGQLAGKTHGDPVYISSRTISDRTHTMLDDMTMKELSERLQTPVVPALTFSDVARDMRSRKANLTAA